MSVIEDNIASRASWFLEANHPGRHLIKRVAGMFDVSPSMAKRLLRGEGWTAARLTLATKMFGPDFVNFVFAPLAGQGGGDGEELASFALAFAKAWMRGPLHVGEPSVGIDGPARSASAFGSVATGEDGRREEVAPEKIKVTP